MSEIQSYLRLSAHWVTNRYHGAEWPPSPARIYQALVAGVHTGGWRDSLAGRAREALLWLEKQPSPTIYAPAFQHGSAYRIAVPNNDLDKAAKAWAKGNASDETKLKTLKSVSPRLLSGEKQQLNYVWPLTAGNEGEALGHAPVLREVSHCLHTLGWGVDMAFADLSIGPDLGDVEGDVWIPSDRGVTLAVPIEGFLEDLEAAYRRFQRRIGAGGVNSDTHPRVYGEVRYKLQRPEGRNYCAFALRASASDDDGRTLLYRKPAEKAAEVAAWLRHAAIEAIAAHPKRDEWMPYVSGHTDVEAKGDRLSYVPLPSIGAAKADGWIRRVMLVEAEGRDGEVTQFLSRALLGKPAIDERRGEVCRWEGLSENDSVVRSYFAYGGNAKVWRTVTPVLLHGFNSQRGQLSLNKTTKLILEALKREGIGADDVEDFFIQTAPLTPQLPAAGAFFLPKQLSKWPRYHIGLELKNGISGPLLVGIGRHYGLGLFRPVG